MKMSKGGRTMKKKLLAILLVIVMCFLAVGCNGTGKKEDYNIAYVTLYTYYTDALTELSQNNEYANFDQAPTYSSWTFYNNNNATTVFLIDDWAYGDNDTIILYLTDGRTLQTASSNVVLMYEPIVEGIEGSSDVGNDNQNAEQSNTGNEIVIAEDGNAVEESVETVDESIYSLEGMSSDEILEVVKKTMENKPVTGQSYDEYSASCIIEPTYSYAYVSDINSSVDNIPSISVVNLSTQMDGTIACYDGKQVQIIVSLVIKDYDKAVDVYNKLYDYLSPTYQNPRNYTEGTSWRGAGDYSIDEWNSIGVNFVGLSRNDNYYYITATYTY